MPKAVLNTTLDLPLIKEGEIYRMDLAGLPIFFGLSVLSQDIVEKIIDQYYLDRVDIDIEKKVKRRETPELAEMQIETIKICGEYDVFRRLLEDQELFHEDLRSVFGTLQMQRWRDSLYPVDPKETSRALVFFRNRINHAGDYPFRVILERLQSLKKNNKFFFRVIFEGRNARRLNLDSFPHVPVEDLGARSFIAGATYIARLFAEQVRGEAMLGKRSYSEIDRTDSYIFSRLQHSGLSSIAMIGITWTESYINLFRVMEPKQLAVIFKKILLVLEDHTVRELIAEGRVIRLNFGEIYAYLDVSQLGRCLNISFGHLRQVPSMDHYLERMPALKSIVSSTAKPTPLANVKLILIHHITAEIIAFIAALIKLGVKDLVTLFVRYGEQVPSDYLESLLEIDQEHYRYYALTKVEDPLSVEGYFVLHPRFSSLGFLEKFDKKLQKGRQKYMETMVALATRLFLESLLETIMEDGKCLIIEDGGYLTPVITEKALRGERLIDLLAEQELSLPEGLEAIGHLSLQEVMDRWLIGTVEHTKNGMDRLEKVILEKGCLARPAFTIAISDFKVQEESSEVAASILSAVESILHSQGKVLSRRRAAVIGSSGAIGRNLMAQLKDRCNAGSMAPVLGVDILPPLSSSEACFQSFHSFQQVPREMITELDLIIGVTGQPAFQWADMQRLLFESRANSFFLASGSTKTIEFESVSQGLEGLLKMDSPRLCGTPCRIEGDDLTDPQTGKVLGQRYRLHLGLTPSSPQEFTTKEISFLGSLMPINFVYYGVPGEIIDQVLAQLLRTALGLAAQVKGAAPLENRLYAVDRDIDVDGQPR